MGGQTGERARDDEDALVPRRAGLALGGHDGRLHARNRDARRAGLLTLIVLVNPVTLVLGFSYMTDIPFLSCTILGLAFYTRAIRRRSYWLAEAPPEPPPSSGGSKKH